MLDRGEVEMINKGAASVGMIDSIVSMNDMEDIEHISKIVVGEAPVKESKGDDEDSPGKCFDVVYDAHGQRTIVSYIEDLCEWDTTTFTLLSILLSEPEDTTIVINAGSMYAQPHTLIATMNAIANSNAKVIVDIRWGNAATYLLAAVADEVTVNETSCVVFNQFRAYGSGTVEQARQRTTVASKRISALYEILRSTGLLTDDEINKLSTEHTTSIWLYGDELMERIAKKNSMSVSKV